MRAGSAGSGTVYSVNSGWKFFEECQLPLPHALQHWGEKDRPAVMF